MSDVSKLKINNVTYNIKDSLALRDAPSDGEEYVRKNGAWAISSGGSEGSGGSGGVNAMYYYEQTVNTATNAEIMRITDSRINTNSIVLECTFANPEYITSDVTWTSYAGYIAFTGTCVAATTANVTIGYMSNDNFSDRLMTLVWENPNPTSDFSSQTISNLDLSSYDFILVKTKLQKSNQEYQDYKNTFIIEKNDNFTMVMHLGAQANSLSANKYTKARIVSFTNNSITIGDCYSRQWNTTSGNSGTVTNSDCIPLAIYGISRYNYFEDHSSTMDLIYDGNPTTSANTSLISGKKFSNYTTLVIVFGNLSNNFSIIVSTNDFCKTNSSGYNNWWYESPNSIWNSEIHWVSDTSFNVGTKGSGISNVKIYGIGRYNYFEEDKSIKDIASQAIIASSSNISNTNCKLLKSGNVINLNFTCSISNVSDGTTNLVSNLPKPKYELLFLGLFQDGSSITTNSRFKLTTDGVLQIYWPHRTISPTCELTTYISYLTVD